MKHYIGKKEVLAEPMNELKAVELGYARPNTDNHEWREGFHIVYPDGYHSWSPADVFSKAYSQSETFIDRLKIELNELAEKQRKLSEFLQSDRLNSLSRGEQVLLEAQFGAMIAYLNILKLRISLSESL